MQNGGPSKEAQALRCKYLRSKVTILHSKILVNDQLTRPVPGPGFDAERAPAGALCELNPHGLAAKYFAGTRVYQFRQPGRAARECCHTRTAMRARRVGEKVQC